MSGMILPLIQKQRIVRKCGERGVLCVFYLIKSGKIDNIFILLLPDLFLLLLKQHMSLSEATILSIPMLKVIRDKIFQVALNPNFYYILHHFNTG